MEAAEPAAERPEPETTIQEQSKDDVPMFSCRPFLLEELEVEFADSPPLDLRPSSQMPEHGPSASTPSSQRKRQLESSSRSSGDGPQSQRSRLSTSPDHGISFVDVYRARMERDLARDENDGFADSLLHSLKAMPKPHAAQLRYLIAQWLAEYANDHISPLPATTRYCRSQLETCPSSGCKCTR